jgi:two-component system cell cycle sensor histidine kinase/response regulator CckA
MNAPLPPDETQRLAALHEYQVLDSLPEQDFDDLTLLAAHICKVPIALVSLVDEKRQWFKSRIGMDASETTREVAFCAHTILCKDEIFEVHDAQADARFATNPLVTDGPLVRFYAGAPLVTPGGHALGALCVMDQVPRTLTGDQLTALSALSRAVVAQLELRRRTAALEEEVRKHEATGRSLRQNIERLTAVEKEATHLLGVAGKSRRALLSILEDEKRAGQSLRESEELFRQMTDSIDEVFWMTGPARNSLLFISSAFQKIWGRSCESLYKAPETWEKSIHRDDHDRVLSQIADRQSRGVFDETYRIVRPDGSIRWIHDRAFPVRDASGTLIRIAGVAEDVTEKKELEAQFFRAQRLESIGTLASGIAHDLNNILAPIMIAGPLIRDSDSKEEIERTLAVIEASVNRGATLVRQLLTFGRGAEGERKTLAVEPVIREMAMIARRTFPKNISIVEKVEADLSPILADPTQVHQVLLNLCVNARDAMPLGGSLVISAKNVRVDAATAAATPGAKPSDYVMIEVADTGTGMNPDIVDKIFNPFFTTKELGKGTGLGLSTVLGLIKGHNGFVTVDSEPGKGSTFRAYFPAHASAGPSAPNAAAAKSPSGHGELILLVDDEENIRDTLRGVLVLHRYAVVVAADGVDAISRFVAAHNGIELLITDLDMPNMDGVTLIQVLRQINPKLRVIVSSGILRGRQMNEQRSSELAALGVNAILEKPYSADQMLAAIHAALASG